VLGVHFHTGNDMPRTLEELDAAFDDFVEGAPTSEAVQAESVTRQVQAKTARQSVERVDAQLARVRNLTLRR